MNWKFGSRYLPRMLDGGKLALVASWELGPRHGRASSTLSMLEGLALLGRTQFSPDPRISFVDGGGVLPGTGFFSHMSVSPPRGSASSSLSSVPEAPHRSQAKPCLAQRLTMTSARCRTMTWWLVVLGRARYRACLFGRRIQTLLTIDHNRDHHHTSGLNNQHSAPDVIVPCDVASAQFPLVFLARSACVLYCASCVAIALHDRVFES